MALQQESATTSGLDYLKQPAVVNTLRAKLEKVKAETHSISN